MKIHLGFELARASSMVSRGDPDGLADETFFVIQPLHHCLPVTSRLLSDHDGCWENLLQIFIIETRRIFLRGQGSWASLRVDLIGIKRLNDACGAA